MRIVFLSNFFNHHQSALSDALWERTGGEYCFVETAPMPRERRELGYETLRRDYVLTLAGNEAKILRLIRDADVVIAGSAPEWLIQRRVRTGKLLLRYLERPLRNGMEPLKILPRWLRWHWRNPKDKPIFLLCASAYTAGDYAKFGLFRGCSFRWGYFPEQKIYDLEELFPSKCPTEVLWCGRFLELKHPEDVLSAAKLLKEADYSFTLKFIGRGEEEETLRQMVKDFHLESCVQFLGARSPEEVRQAMERAGIYLFTSDRREGWGAVLNEAMNSGCAVIASHAIGSVPYLIKDRQNGLVYPSGNVELLAEKLRYLLDAPIEQRRLGKAAYETIRDCWNPETAAERLITLSRGLLENTPVHFAEGPCSPAEEINEDWFP